MAAPGIARHLLPQATLSTSFLRRIMAPGGSSVCCGGHPQRTAILPYAKGIRGQGKISLQAMSCAPITLEYLDPLRLTPTPPHRSKRECHPRERKRGRACCRGIKVPGTTNLCQLCYDRGCRAGAGNASFEIVPSPEFTASGLFTLSVDKGAVTAGSNVPVSPAACPSLEV